MRGAVLYGPRDLRFEERDIPAILKPTDAIVRNSATCVVLTCGHTAESTRFPRRRRWGTSTAALSRTLAAR